MLAAPTAIASPATVEFWDKSISRFGRYCKTHYSSIPKHASQPLTDAHPLAVVLEDFPDAGGYRSTEGMEGNKILRHKVGKREKRLEKREKS